MPTPIIIVNATADNSTIYNPGTNSNAGISNNKGNLGNLFIFLLLF